MVKGSRGGDSPILEGLRRAIVIFSKGGGGILNFFQQGGSSSPRSRPKRKRRKEGGGEPTESRGMEEEIDANKGEVSELKERVLRLPRLEKDCERGEGARGGRRNIVVDCSRTGRRVAFVLEKKTLREERDTQTNNGERCVAKRGGEKLGDISSNSTQ